MIDISFDNVTRVTVEKTFFPVTEKSHSNKDFWNVQIEICCGDESHTINLTSDKEVDIEDI